MRGEGERERAREVRLDMGQERWMEGAGDAEERAWPLTNHGWKERGAGE